MKNPWSNKSSLLLALTCISFAVLGVLRLNDTSLYTDSTRYVIWGTSVSHLKGFVDDTQPDPERYVVNAPFYSVVLAPILLVFPNSLVAAKIWTLLLGECALVLFFVWLKRRMGPTRALIGTLILAFNPLMLVMATEAMSEMCFLALTIAALILIESFEGTPSMKSRDTILLVIIVSVLPLLREISVALVAAVTMIFFLRKYDKAAFWIAGGTILLFALWMVRNLVLVGIPATSQSTNLNFILGHFVTTPDTPIISELIQRVFVNIQSMYAFFTNLLLFPFPQSLIVDPYQLFKIFFRLLVPGKYILPIIALPLVVLGINVDLKNDPNAAIRILFCAFYILIILIYPVQDIRFLLPLLPFFVYFLLLSMQHSVISRYLTNRTLRISLACLASAVAILPNIDCDIELARTNWKYTHSPDELYAGIKKSGVNKEIYTRPWKLFGDWIQHNLPDSTVIASTYKELSIFIGDRKILEINYGVPLPMFERLLRDNGVDYLLSAEENAPNRPYEFAMSESKRFWFEPIHVLNGLQLYKVHSSWTERPAAARSEAAVADTSTAAGHLRWGRTLLLRGEYSYAEWEFANAFAEGSSPALTIYQMTVAFALAGQRFEATKALAKLYRMPQSTSYIPAATMHLRMMETLLNAPNNTGTAQKSEDLFSVAAFYWNFGYYNQGYSLDREILKEDSSYFVGLLWGWDYAKTLGDEKQAKRYLTTLESIDRTNPVVAGYRAIAAIDDTLGRSNNPSERSRLELEQGKIYWSIGLYDEAFDNLEHSIGDDRHNSAAYEYLSQCFEAMKHPWALRKVRRMMGGQN